MHIFKSIALGIGVSLCLLGAEFLVLDKVVLAAPSQSAENGLASSFAPKARAQEYVPPEWMPWSLLSAGAVTIIYSFTIPRRMAA